VLSQNVTVGDSSNESCVSIAVVNDNLVENDQTFNVTMTTMDSRLLLVNDVVPVVILADSADSEFVCVDVC